jgi:hypothetical protein
MGSDYRDDLEGITAGSAKYQLIGGPSGKDERVDSNAEMQLEDVELAVHYRLSTTERAYTEGALQTNLAAMADRDFFRGLAACYDVAEGASIEYEITREGDVVSFSVSTTVVVVPD